MRSLIWIDLRNPFHLSSIVFIFSNIPQVETLQNTCKEGQLNSIRKITFYEIFRTLLIFSVNLHRNQSSIRKLCVS